jgi:hypothetical protein
MCAPEDGASTLQKIRHSVHETVWYGPLLIYVAVTSTLSAVLLLAGIKVG